MPHFFIPPEKITGKSFVLTGPEVHHLRDVRRCSVGDTLNLFDGTGKTYAGRIEHASRDEIRGSITAEGQSAVPPVRVHLFQAVPKGDRFDWLVEKAAELGVDTITPLITRRSVVREIAPAKLERWRRLSLAASQQSGRADILAVTPVMNFLEAARPREGGVGIVPWESEDTRAIEEGLFPPELRHADIFIGPEGGFTPEEIERARAGGCLTVTLGPRILRAETAGLVASVLVLNAAGSFGKGT